MIIKIPKTYIINTYGNIYDYLKKSNNAFVFNKLLEMPNIMQSFLLMNKNNNLNDLNNLLYFNSFKKTKKFKLILYFDIFYRLIKKIYFFNQIILKIIKFLMFWKDLKIEHELYYFKYLINKYKLNSIRFFFLKNKILLIIKLYKKITMIYVKILKKLYNFKLYFFKKIFETELPQFLIDLKVNLKLNNFIKKILSLLKNKNSFNDYMWWNKNLNLLLNQIILNISTINFNKLNNLNIIKLLVVRSKIDRHKLKKMMQLDSHPNNINLYKYRLRYFINKLYNIEISDLYLFYNKYKKYIKNWYDFFLLFENKLDSILFKLHIGNTIKHTRSIIQHSGIQINNNRIYDYMYLIKPGDLIEFSNNFNANSLNKYKYFYFFYKNIIMNTVLKYKIKSLIYNLSLNLETNIFEENKLIKNINNINIDINLINNYYFLLTWFNNKNQFKLITYYLYKFNKLYKFIKVFFKYNKQLLIFNNIKKNINKSFKKYYDYDRECLESELYQYKIQNDEYLYWIEDNIVECNNLNLILNKYQQNEYIKFKKIIILESKIRLTWYRKYLIMNKIKNILKYLNILSIKNNKILFYSIDKNTNIIKNHYNLGFIPQININSIFKY